MLDNKSRIIWLLMLCLFSSAMAQQPAPADPYRVSGAPKIVNAIDRHVFAGLKAAGLQPALRCSDEVFIRRVYLDLTGRVPGPKVVVKFLRDRRPDKRAKLIDALLASDDFVDYWTLKWCDLLRVKAEFPINLWPNGVQAYYRYLHDAVRTNKPYDRMMREFLTASGSNFRVPEVNFYLAMQGRDSQTIARTVALTAMGVRLENWPALQQQQMAQIFERVHFKPTAEWKETIVMPAPAPCPAVTLVMPDGRAVTVDWLDDRRVVFADWLLAPDNPWFARNGANRIWAWLMGRGVVEEPDDFRADNPPSNPALLDYLTEEYRRSGYDMRHMFRLILNSWAYQQSCIPRQDNPRNASLFACYSLRRLEAEVLIDALNGIFGSSEDYQSMIPEPFTIIPRRHRTVRLADGSISSAQLEMFGRPARDTGLMRERNNQTSRAQCLYLLNARHLQKKIEGSRRLKLMIRYTRGDRKKMIFGLYLSILNRRPTDRELVVAEKYFQQTGVNPRWPLVDLAWALVNSNEFLYRH